MTSFKIKRIKSPVEKGLLMIRCLVFCVGRLVVCILNTAGALEKDDCLTSNQWFQNFM